MKGVTQEEIVSITRQPLLDSMTPGRKIIVIIIIIAEKCLTTKNTEFHQQTRLMLIGTPGSFSSSLTHLLGVRFDST